MNSLTPEAKNWLTYAQEDLSAAEQLLNQPFIAPPRHICWLAQQAAEKMLKTSLIAIGTGFPRSHDLDALRNLLPHHWTVHTTQPDLSELTEWAVESRYPGNWPAATPTDANKAVKTAQELWQTLKTDLVQNGVVGL